MLLEGIRDQKKILWRINFALIKCLLTALLFEKSWNEYKNPLYLRKAACIESDHGSTKMRHCHSIFVALYCRRLWNRSFLRLKVEPRGVYLKSWQALNVVNRVFLGRISTDFALRRGRPARVEGRRTTTRRFIESRRSYMYARGTSHVRFKYKYVRTYRLYGA